MSAQRPTLLSSELHPLSIIRMFWKRRVLVAVTWFLGTIVAGVVVWQMPTVYTSEALVLVDSQKIPERYVASTVSADLQDRIATISQQILSSTQLKKIIDDFDLYKEDRKRLVQEEILDKMKKDITINLERGWSGNRPGAFRIGYQGPDPAIVAQVANRLANLYIEENLKVREVQAEGTSEFMTTQLQEAKKRLDELEAAVSDYKVKHLGELPQQETSISGDLARAETDLKNNRESIRRAEESRLVLQNTLGVAEATVATLLQPGTVVQPNGTVSADPAPVALPPNQVQVLQTKLDLLRARYGDEHPEVRRARAELAEAVALQRISQPVAEKQPSKEAKKEPAQKSAAVQATASAPRNPPERDFQLGQAQERVVSLKSNIASLDQEIQARKSDEGRIVQAINVLQAKLGRLPVREQELAKISRDYEISKANYKTLLDKSLSAEMATDMEHRQKAEKFTVLDPARVPEKPTKPNRPLLGSAGALMALVLGLVMSFGLEAKKGTILGEWELPKDVPILGRLPVIDLTAPSADSPKRRWFRLALVSSALVLILGGIAAGLYFSRRPF